jgi:hypothetical protein
MKYFATNYNHTAGRMERISQKFESYAETVEWIETNGPRNVDGEPIAMVGHDYYEATDYPIADTLVVEILETVEAPNVPERSREWYTAEQSAEDNRRSVEFIETYDDDQEDVDNIPSNELWDMLN